MSRAEENGAAGDSDPVADDSANGYELYSSVAEEIEKTHQKQLAAHESLTEKAVDLVKLNLLSVSLVATGLSISEFSFSWLLVGGLLSSIYAVWASAQVFEPTRYPRGISAKGGSKMDQKIRDGTATTEYARTILYSYIAAVDDFRDKFEYERNYFTRSVWATFAGVSSIVVAVVEIVSLSFPIWVDYPALLLVAVVAAWGNDKSSQREL